LKSKKPENRILFPQHQQSFSNNFLSWFSMFTVYVLYSEKYKKHYTGFTSDLPGRLISHNELGKDWTKDYRP
jgi:hypothetical protein